MVERRSARTRMILVVAAVITTSLVIRAGGTRTAGDGDAVSRGTPFSSSLPANPTIAALLEDVSADSLQSYVQRLVGFHTRHMNSDTVSSTVGIGAARRWIRSRFDAHASTPGSNMAPSYFSFVAQTCMFTTTHRNVVNDKVGTLQPERHFLVSGHMDSRIVDNCDASSAAPGANDDGSGVAAVLEMSRVLAGTDLDASLLLLAFTGEENGLIGSTRYAVFADTSGLRLDGMVTNDIVGNIVGCANPACPDGEPVIVDSMSVRHFSRGPDTSSSRQLARAIKLAGLRYMSEFEVTMILRQDRPGRGGDHIPFGNRGFAAARFTEANEDGVGDGSVGHQHNGDDLIEYMNFPYLARVTRLNLAAFANLALAPERPSMPSVEDLGDGNLNVTWPSVTTAPDLAGYRVALRRAGVDSTFYYDVLDAGLDAGPVQEFSIGGLPTTDAFLVSVSAYDTDFNESIFSDEAEAVIAVGDPSVDLADAIALRLLTPNPSGDVARIAFDLDTDARVSAEVVDAQGRLVRRLAVGLAVTRGVTELSWNGDDTRGARVGAGVYFVRIRVDGRVAGSVRLVRAS